MPTPAEKPAKQKARILTDTDFRRATCPPGKQRHRLTDSGGSKRWFWKFRMGGKEHRLALGSYPAVSLKAARQAREDASENLKRGENPIQRRKVEKLTTSANKAATFEAMAREFHQSKAQGWSPSHADRWTGFMERHAFPHLGTLALADITTPMVLDVLRKVEARGALETAHKLSQAIGQVFRYGISPRTEKRETFTRLLWFF